MPDPIDDLRDSTVQPTDAQRAAQSLRQTVLTGLGLQIDHLTRVVAIYAPLGQTAVNAELTANQRQRIRDWYVATRNAADALAPGRITNVPTWANVPNDPPPPPADPGVTP